MTLRKIYFRADGNPQIGLGHVIRSLALIEMLKEEFECHFIIHQSLPILVEQIGSVCESIIKLSTSSKDVDEAERIANNYLTNKDIIVLDGYEFKTSYQQVFKNHGCKVVCIDDIYSYHFVADAIINHAGGIVKTLYSAESYTQFFLGLKYALLRKPFLTVAKSDVKDFDPNSVFLCLGGADPNNDTLTILKKCENELKEGIYYVIIGGSNPHKEILETYQKRSTLKIHLLYNLSANEMVTTMMKCGSAITAPSSVSLEYLCIGGQLFLKPIADNQKHIFDYLVRSKNARPIEDFFLNKQKNLIQHKPIIDGKQEYRFTNLFKNLHIQLEQASTAHSSLYLEWANDPETRKQSLNSDLIQLDTHIKWFNKKVSDENCLMLLGTLDQEPVGQIRLEINKEEALINYSVAPAYRGKGIGYTLLQKAIHHVFISNPTISTFIGFVKMANIASVNIFRRLGFEEKITMDNQQELYRFELQIG